MAPSIIVGYSKNLSEFPECDSRDKLRVGYLISSDYSLIRLTEWALVNSPDKYQYCLTAVIIGGDDNDWLQEIAIEMRQSGTDEAGIINYIRGLGAEDEDDDACEHSARFVYKSFQFRIQTENDIGVQIKGAYVHPSKEQKALARTIYAFLLNWHRHVVCDNHQTVYGAKIWAKGMLSVGRVQVYDDLQQQFVDTLALGGIGQAGVKPWDALLLSEQQISHWNPNALSIDPASKILAIISASDRIDKVGITTFDSTQPRLRVS
ncbi:Uncharacterised protein [Yersinia frederiksenii]|nr:Uncharacterised protein [Yersinia frederiksenii]